MDRKRTMKTAGLAVCLALCLTLSGCYIAPEDINNDYSGSAGTNGALPFQTLAPTATVETTPETVAIETQNLFGGNQNSGGGTQQIITVTDSSATPTPAPASAQDSGNPGWNDWGTVSGTGDPAQGTATPEPGAAAFPTAEPASAATGGQATIQVVTSAPATPTPTPPSLQVGFKDSEEVRALQKRLRELGYYNGSVDGDFGKGTEDAVKAFQKANGLKADGKAGTQTLAKLNSRDAISWSQANATPTKKVTATPTKKVTPTPRPTATPDLSNDYYLQTGSSGAKVKTLQNRLIELGYLAGRATGEYDSATRRAVMAFQKKTRGLYDDGVAGPATLRALYSADAARASSTAASTGETLERGSEGAAVRALQKRLKELKYLSGSVDGSYGVSTEAAVIAFQQANGLTPDGKAGTATLEALYSQTAVPSGGNSANTGTSSASAASQDTSGIASTGYVTLEMGSQGSAVRKLQQKLRDLGYYTGSVDGSYGEGTVAAVMAFQLINNLTVDGKAGPATQRVLFGSGSAISYAALREGDSGTAVKNLQYTLYELGYYDGRIDGNYGTTTSDAVRAFQIQNNLKPVDGVAGSNTLAKLYSADAVPASAAAVDYDTVRPGDRGEIVVEIQDCLIQMGYLEEITGVYDDETTAAVRAFQKANGLTADGVCGSRTLALLFGY